LTFKHNNVSKYLDCLSVTDELFVKSLCLRNYVVNFVATCTTDVTCLIITVARRILNSDKKYSSYSDLYSDVTFWDTVSEI